MKSVTLSLGLCFTFILLTTACISPKKSLENENYKGAFDKAISKLEKGEKKRENVVVLKKALDGIIAEDVALMENRRATGDLAKMEKNFKLYKRLNEYFDRADPHMGKELDSLRSYFAEDEALLRTDLANAYFDNGMDAWESYQESELKSAAQAAHQNLVNAKRFEHPYAHLDSLLDESLRNAILYVGINAEPRFGFGNSWDIDRQFDNAEFNFSNTYRKVIYDPSNWDKLDCRMYVEIDDPRSDIREDSSQESFDKEIISASDTTVVSGTVQIIRIRKTMRLDARVELEGNKNCGDRDYRSFSASLTDEGEEYRLSGDQRAIPSKYKNQMSADLEDDDDMEEDLLEELYDDIMRWYF